MTEAKFTPGPWRVETGEGEILAGGDNDFSVIGGCGCCGSPWINGDNYDGSANARLIAAAPDMYAILDDAWPYVSDAKTRGAIAAVLRKARGEAA